MLESKSNAKGRRRRGAVGIGSVVALVFLQLLLVGGIVTGARDQGQSVQRLNTMRAFYAAEGAMNMAIREMVNNADEDGDGTIGSISNDGNSANDPVIGTSQVYVVKSASGTVFALTSRARCDQCRRQLVLAIE